MSDQAQGLRALADQARRAPGGFPSQPAQIPGAGSAGSAGNRTDVLHAEALSLEDGVAVADARVHTAASRSGYSGQRHARIVAVTSGKGGVGKTNFSTNLALLLAQSGQRVIVLDADLGLANLHVVMGITPRFHLEHVMRGEKTLRDVLYPGPGGIQIIGGGSGITELANLDETTRGAFIQGLSELDSLADVIIIDTGAGLSHNVMGFLCAVEEIIVVTTPEPTAITDAYATIKVVSHDNPQAHLMLVVNMAQSEAEAEAVANKLSLIARQFLRVELDCLGYIPQDPAVARAVRSQQPFALYQPQSPAAHGVARIASQLGFRHVSASPPPGIGGFLNRVQRFFSLRNSTGAGAVR